MQLLTVLLLGLGLAAASRPKTKPPGLRIQLTRTGLDYGAIVGRQVLNYQLPRTVFPDLKVKVAQGPGHGQAQLYNISVAAFDAPAFNYALQPDNSILWMSHGGSVQVTGEWDAWYKVLFRARLSGQIEASATDLNIEIASDISQPSPGAMPSVNISHCSVSIGDFNINIRGGVVQWFVNLFRYQIATRIKTQLQDQICAAVSGALLSMANAQIQTLPTVIPLYKSFFLHYGMTSPPLVTDNFVETKMEAEVTWRGEITPVRPSALPPLSIPETGARMLYLTGSDFVLNSFLHSAHAHKAIQFLLRPDMLPGPMQGFMNTSCPLMCIGKVIPAIGRKFPNDSVDVHLYSLKAPIAEVHPDGAVVNATVRADVFGFPIRQNPVSPDKIFSLNIDLSLSLFPYMGRGSVAANVTVARLALAAASSNIGPIPPASLGLLTQALRPALQAFVNGQLGRGLRIPTVEGVGLAKASLRLLERAVVIETDIRYKSFFPRDILARLPK